MYSPRYIILLMVFMLMSDVTAQPPAGNKRILYVGINNELTYALQKYDTGFVAFKASDGELFSKFNFWTWASCNERLRSVTIYALNKRSFEPIDSIRFMVDVLPDPSVIIPRSQHYMYWGRKELYKNRLKAAFVGDKMKFKCRIKSFSIRLKKQIGMTKEYENTDEKYTEGAIGLLQQFEKGDTVYFNNFVVNCGCESSTRMLADRLMFTRIGNIVKIDREE